jgi:hypothetical protein
MCIYLLNLGVYHIEQFTLMWVQLNLTALKKGALIEEETAKCFC